MPVSTYTFRSVGADAVVRDYDKIGAAQKRARAPRGGAGGGSSGGGTRGFSPEQQAAKAAAQARRAEEREVDRLAKFKARVRDRSMAIEQRDVERAEARKLKTAERAAKDHSKLQLSQRRDATRLNREMVAIEQRDMAAHMRHREAQAKKWKQRASSLGRAGSAAAWGIAGGVASLGIAAGSAFAGVAGASVRSRLAERDQAIALSNAGRGGGQGAVSADSLLADATKTALSVKGTKTSDILAAQARYVQMTGDLSSARSNAKTMALTARATGSSEEDIAATMATMSEKFGVKDPIEMRNALATMVGQGKSGAFELKDASQYFTELGAAGQRFGLDKGTEGIATLGGLSQIAMKSAGNGAKASTGVQAMLRQLVARDIAGKEGIKALTGASVFTDKSHTKTRDVKDVLVDVIGGAKGDQTKLQKIFGDEGMVGASALVSGYNEAANGTSGSAAEKRAAGEAAVRKMLDETISAAGTWKDVLVDYAAATNTAGATLTTAWEKLSSDVGDSLAPAFTKIVTAMAPLAGSLKPFAEGLAIATDRVVGLAKKMGWIDEDKPEEQTTVPKAELYNTTAELAGLDAKEKKLGGLTPADQDKRAQLQTRQLELKDQLLTADPTIGDTPFTMLDDLGYQKGKGPMRIDKRTGFDRIIEGEGLESKDDQKAWYQRSANNHATTLADEYNNAGWLDKASIVGGFAMDNALNGKAPWTALPGSDDNEARERGTMRDALSRFGSDATLADMNAAPQKVVVEIKPIPGFSTTVSQGVGAPK